MARFIAVALLALFILGQAETRTSRRKGLSDRQHKAMKLSKDPQVPETRFQLYGQPGDKEERELCRIVTYQPHTLDECSFNASQPLVVIVHGWSIDGMLERWIWKMADALQSHRQQSNVIIADWLSLAHQHYAIAVQNTRLVGQEIAELIEWLELSTKFDRRDAHLIGYSLGAHVAGFSGSYVSGSAKIGRITGLDPAGPLFEGMSATDRLSPDDASFVDAIHTFTQQHMGLSVGIKQSVAHYDFYPNGGAFQPGCHFRHLYDYIAEYGITGIAATVKCAHERAVHLFIDSLLHEDKQSMAYWCNDINTFNKGFCLNCRKNRCNTLGINIRKERPIQGRKLYLKTRAHMPYKVYHYQFKIHFINQITEREIEPTFTVSLTGTKEDAENLPIVPGDGIRGNKTYSFLITLDTDIGELMMIKFKWEGTDVWANIWDTMQTIIPWTTGTPKPGVIVKTIRVKVGDTQQKMIFCPQQYGNVQLHPTQEKTYVRCEKQSGKRGQNLQQALM